MTASPLHPLESLMLIDDSSFDQMIYKRIVEKSGLVRNLVQFLDATEAVDYLGDPASTPPDLILLDVNMPQMDGFEFLEAVTERFGADLCPVVVMLTTSLNPMYVPAAVRKCSITCSQEVANMYPACGSAC